MATGPRFCDGGVDAEKAVVCEGLLMVLEGGGWKLRQGIDRTWMGKRSIDEVAIAGEDADDSAILSHILSQVVGSLTELRADPRQNERLAHQEHAMARALAEEDRTWRCAARLATISGQGSKTVKSECSLFLVWVIETVEPRGLLVSNGLGKILAGDRDLDSVAAGADLCDSACLKKVLEYISAITDGRESADDWPTTLVTLTGPNGNTARFIDANQQSFEMIATASNGDDGDGAKQRLREVLDGWELCNWQERAGVELMWRGERRDHLVLGSVDSNSRHVLRAILRAFDAFASPPSAAAASTERPCRYGSGCRRADCRYVHPADWAPPLAASARRHGQNLEQVKDFTGCTEEQALECLDAADGSIEQAVVLALDAVGHA